MNKLKKLIIVPTIIFLLLNVIACSDTEKNKTAADPAYLLPQLQHQVIDKITLRSLEGSTTLIRHQQLWWVEKPVDYPADTRPIEAFLRTLIDAEIGKRINITAADHEKLALTVASGGIEVTLQFAEQQQITLTFGQLSFPKDNDTRALFGAAYAARRYVRVSNKQTNSDDVYLVPISLVDLSSTANLWTDFAFIRIPSFAQLTIKSAGKIQAQYFREKMFAALYKKDAAGNIEKVQNDLFACFEKFLKMGKCLQVGLADSALTIGKPSHSEIIVTDFLGDSYHFNFGLPEEPSAQESKREELQASFVNDGVAATRVPFTLTINAANNTNGQTLNPIAKNLQDKNQQLAKQLQQRLIYLKLENFSCLSALLEGDL